MIKSVFPNQNVIVDKPEIIEITLNSGFSTKVAHVINRHSSRCAKGKIDISVVSTKSIIENGMVHVHHLINFSQSIDAD